MLLWFVTLALLVFGFTLYLAAGPMVCWGLLPFFLLDLHLLHYFETWKIVLTAKTLEKRVFWISRGVYSYGQITDCFIGHYFSEQSNAVVIVLEGKKKLRFRTDSENADQAIKRIKNHRSIRNL